MADDGVGTLLPPEVVEQLLQLHEEQADLTGWWRTSDLADALGIGMNRTRSVLRDLMRAGRLEARRISLTDEQAQEIGWLGGSSGMFYRLKEGP